MFDMGVTRGSGLIAQTIKGEKEKVSEGLEVIRGSVATRKDGVAAAVTNSYMEAPLREFNHHRYRQMDKNDKIHQLKEYKVTCGYS